MFHLFLLIFKHVTLEYFSEQEWCRGFRRSLLNYVLYAPLHLTCLLAFVSYTPLSHACLRALPAFAPYVPSRLRVLHTFESYVPSCLTRLRALRAFVPYTPTYYIYALYLLALPTRLARFFQVPWVPYLCAFKSY